MHSTHRSSDVECLVHTRSSFLSHLVAVWRAPNIITVPAVVSCMYVCMYVCVYISSTHCIILHITCVLVSCTVPCQYHTCTTWDWHWTIVCFLVNSLIFSVLWFNFVFHSDGLIRWNHLRNNWKVRFHTSNYRKWSNITTCVSYIVTSHLQYKLHSYWFFCCLLSFSPILLWTLGSLSCRASEGIL